MTGYKSKYLRHDCNKSGCYFNRISDWSDIIEILPHHIRPTDIDGGVHIKDHFLFLDEKSINAGIAPGQRYYYKALSKRERMTIAVFRPGHSGDICIDVEVMIFRDGQTAGWQHMTRLGFLCWIETWAWSADQTETEKVGENAALQG